MGSFANLSADLIPAGEAIVKDLGDAIGASMHSSALANALSRPLADAIAATPEFMQSVNNRSLPAAANAAARAVSQAIMPPLTAVVEAALTSARTAQQDLSQQLRTVTLLLDPCNRAANYAMFMLEIIFNKTTLDAQDQSLLQTWWARTDSQLADFYSLRDRIATLSDRTTKATFNDLVKAIDGKPYAEIGTAIKNLGNTAPEGLALNFSILCQTLRDASKIGVLTLKAISNGLRNGGANSLVQRATLELAVKSASV